MRTTEQRMAAVTKRAATLEKQRQKRKNIVVSISVITTFLVLIVGMGCAMPEVMEKLAKPSSSYTGFAASLFTNSAAMGYILCGSLAFILGVCVTILCYRLYFRNKEDKDD